MFEFLNGVPGWHVAISILFVLYFCQSYYRHCLAKGLPVDLYHGLIFLQLIFPMFVMSIFAYSAKNSLFVGGAASAILQPYIGEAFGVTALGSAMVLAVSSRTALVNFPCRLSWLRRTSELFFELVREPSVTIAHGCIAILGIAFVEAYLIVHFGASAFDLKESALGAVSIRPLSNFFMMAYGPLAMFSLLVCWIKFRVRRAIIVAFVLVALESLSGSRGSMLGPLLITGLLLAGRKKGQVKMTTVIFTVALLGSSVIGVEMAQGTTREPTARQRILYGNDFSDVRDFAHILSMWDRQKLYGKTYAAGFLGFVPRTLMPYRQEYSFATYFNRVVGFEKDTHGGLRPGPFGEAYLNFGIPGVVIMGILQGLIFGFIRSRLDRLRALGVCDIRILASQTAALYMLSAITVTSAVWDFYVFVIVSLGSMAIRRMFTGTGEKQLSPRGSRAGSLSIAATQL